MAKIVSSEVMIAAVDTGNEDDMYPVLAYLRDTCIPLVRPLHAPMRDICYDGCKAAGLVKHQMDDGSTTYELIVWHHHLEKRFRADFPRRTPTLDAFNKHITGK